MLGESMATNDSLQPSSEHLALLYRLSQTFNSSLDLDEVLNRVMDQVIAVMRAERGFVMLLEDDGRPVFRVARGIDQSTIDEPHFQVSRGVVERVAREGQPILTSDAQSDDRFSTRESVMILGLRAILCVPLMIKDQVLGVVYVDNRLRAGIFTQADLELLSAIASSAAVAIENARLYQVAVEKGRLQRELQMAYEIQTDLLPHQTPQIPGWEFAARWQPAREVAGDYYDFIWLDPDPGKGDRSVPGLGIVVADVSDKGMPAALFMALTRSTIRASVAHSLLPADGIAHANRLVCADSTSGMFVTLFYGLLDPAAGQFTYVNAGHNPPLLYRAAQDRLLELSRTGMALGVVADSSFKQSRVELHSGDFVLLYTDGVTDATDTQQREFGEERLRRVVFEQRHASVEEMVAALERAVKEFVGVSAPFDDMTIVGLKRP
jgi:sigma-B regulation protein RsbU (phosphoserine phosphatase)